MNEVDRGSTNGEDLAREIRAFGPWGTYHAGSSVSEIDRVCTSMNVSCFTL